MTSNLIRVKSTLGDTGSVIRNTLNDNIEILPNSKIALVSASIKFSNKFIEVNANNNSFNFRCKGDTSSNNMNVSLSTGTYNETDFLRELRNKMNSVLDLTKTLKYSDTLGQQAFEWQPMVNSNNVLGFKYGQSVVTNNGLDNLKNLTETSKTEYEAPAMGGTYQAYGWSNSHFVNGCGRMRFILDDNSATGGGICCGLLDSTGIPNVGQSTLLESAFKYGIAYDGAGNNYDIIVDGVAVDSGIAQGDAKVCEIKLSEGEITFTIDSTDYGTTYTYDYNNAGYSAGATFKAQLCKITGFNWSMTPFQKTTDENGVIDFYNGYQEGNIYELNENLEITNPKKSKVTIELNSAELLDLYGFLSTPPSIQAAYGVFNGHVEINASNTPSSLVVSLPNLQLNSYDGRINKRKSILAVIPSVKLDNIDELIYESSNLVFVSLNNKYAFRLSEIEVRIENGDTGDEIVIQDPGVNLTLLVIS